MKGEKKGLLKPTIQITVLSLFGIFLNFLTQLVVAYYFGASAERDAYFAAMVMPTYISAILTGSIGVIFLPMYVDVKAKKGEQEAVFFLGNSVILTSLISAIIILLSIFFSKELVSLTAPGFKGEQVSFTSELLTILLPTISFQIISNIAGSVLQVQHRFILPALAPVLSAILILITVAILSPYVGIRSLAYGTLAGNGVICVLTLFSLGKKVVGGFRLNLKDAAVLKLLRISAPLLIAGIFYRLTGVFERGIASYLPDGSISYLGYANQIMIILATVTSSGIATTIYPLLSKAWSLNDLTQVRLLMIKGIRIVLLISLPVSAIFAIFGVQIFQFLFERGAFIHETTLAVSSAFSIMTFAFIANSLGSVVTKIFYLSNKTITAAIAEIGGLLFYLVPAFLLSQSLGYKGMAIATSIGGTLSISLSFILVSRILKTSLLLDGVGNDLVKTVVSLILSMLVAYLVYYGAGMMKIADFMSFILAMIFFIPVYIICLKYFRIEEIKYLTDLYKKSYEKNSK
jgi:putative peptidoglycan lipid II flippase